MAIRFSCPSCAKVFCVRDQIAGREVRCVCGRTLTIPAESQSSEPPIALDSRGTPDVPPRRVAATSERGDLAVTRCDGGSAPAPVTSGPPVKAPGVVLPSAKVSTAMLVASRPDGPRRDASSKQVPNAPGSVEDDLRLVPLDESEGRPGKSAPLAFAAHRDVPAAPPPAPPTLRDGGDIYGLASLIEDDWLSERSDSPAVGSGRDRRTRDAATEGLTLPSRPRPSLKYVPPARTLATGSASSGAFASGVALMLLGLVIGGVGVAITVGTYAAAEPGGVYFVAYGPVIIGGITFFRGLAQMFA